MNGTTVRFQSRIGSPFGKGSCRRRRLRGSRAPQCELQGDRVSGGGIVTPSLDIQLVEQVARQAYRRARVLGIIEGHVLGACFADADLVGHVMHLPLGGEVLIRPLRQPGAGDDLAHLVPHVDVVDELGVDDLRVGAAEADAAGLPVGREDGVDGGRGLLDRVTRLERREQRGGILLHGAFLSLVSFENDDNNIIIR